MKAFVDQDSCIGCGMCCGVCPEVFRMNDDGKAEACGDVTAANRGAVQEAIGGCPMEAISEEV